MTHQASTHSTFNSICIAFSLFAALTSVACSDSPLASAPLSPSALPSLGAALETTDATAVTDGWSTLGKGNDNGKGKDGDKSKDDDKGKGKDEGGTVDSPVDAAAVVVEIEGAVATVTGTCPAKTVTVGTQTFTTSESTTYKGGTCADVIALALIEVRATTQATGTLVATSIKVKDADDEDADEGVEEEDDEASGGNPHDGLGPFEGTVSSFRGVCPTVTFNLRGMQIVTSATTTYAGGTCATLRPNVQVVVTGTRVGETRAIEATNIEITRTH
jgi:hypothetical protein